jgi:hypothetical protein
MIEKFVESFTAMSVAFEENALKKGFWSDNPTVGDKIALMHQELSELLETYRSDSKPSAKIPDFSEAEEEVADLIIRAADFGYHYSLRIAEAIVAKHAYNTGRPYKHGKNF